jgi:nitronate monooxygenase
MGSNAVTKAATEVTYKTVWVAGPTIENTNAIRPVTAIVDTITV